MKQVQRLAVRMSKSRYPVLILGETGTGKEVVARAIHNLEGKGRFVVVDCSSLVAPLMESEIFGHVKGAYTGAHVSKLGLLDEANGGTAFFDEVGELPLDLQMKLLRVLQEKEFRAIGALATRSSNFRVIAATNRNLDVEVAEKRFRQDLYYRLNVMKLRLPALRERRDDIPVLISHFLHRHANGHKVSDEVMDLLCEYDWPGNVRELEHTVQTMVALNTGPWISPADLPSALVNRAHEKSFHPGSASADLTGPEEGTDSAENIVPLDELIRRAIIKTLRTTKGDRTLAATMLGIGRTTLYRKLKEYGMQD
jgi:DNA-binding NtrC family response regulator